MEKEKEYQLFGKEWEAYLMKRVKKSDMIKMYRSVCIELQQVKSVDLDSVVGRSEQLVAFLKWVGDGYDFENNAEKIVNEYISEVN